MDRYTVVFLVDTAPPRRVVLLRRAVTKTFAPGRYTGIGGRGETGETLLATASRELQEETGLDLALTEFARCLVDEKRLLSYWWAIYTDSQLPECSEGELEWVSVDRLLDKAIIPTTREVIKEWKHRCFEFDRPFTVRLARQSDEIDSPVVAIEVRNGLSG